MQYQTAPVDWYSNLRPLVPGVLRRVEHTYLGEYEDDNYPKRWYDTALVAALYPFDQAIAGSFA